MDTYTTICYDLSKQLTAAYSTSFGWSIRLFPPQSRRHIYALYGLVRVADEIVDSYRGEDVVEQLNQFEASVHQALENGFSSNPLIHAFVCTARQYDISRQLIDPFFASMRTDTQPRHYTKTDYRHYIYGSAEVIGLMILKVFVDRDVYHRLTPGAKRLGAAYQKINFLRDIKADHAIGRWYFPEGSFETFDDAQKESILANIETDMTAARSAIDQLPRSARPAIALSYHYYNALFKRLQKASAAQLKSRRIRVPNVQKFFIFLLRGIL